MSPTKIPTVQARAAHQKPMMPSAASKPAARQVGSSATKVHRMMMRVRIQKRAPSDTTSSGYGSVGTTGAARRGAVPASASAMKRLTGATAAAATSSP